MTSYGYHTRFLYGLLVKLLLVYKLSEILCRGSSLFLIQPRIAAPPPPAISSNIGCFLFCVWEYPRIFALHPDKPVQAKSYMHGHSRAGSASLNSFY